MISASAQDIGLRQGDGVAGNEVMGGMAKEEACRRWGTLVDGSKSLEAKIRYDIIVFFCTSSTYSYM